MKKFLLITASFLVILILFFAVNTYKKIHQPNVIKSGDLFIPSTATYDEFLKLIEPFLIDFDSFEWVAGKKKLEQSFKPGKYRVQKNYSNNELANLLRSGKQTPVSLTFNNQETLEKLAGRVAKQIEADSVSLVNAFYDANFLENNHFDYQSALGMFVPNTYQFYWNTSATSFRSKMLNEYHRFWTQERLEKSQKLGFTPHEVITLASIVQKETSYVPERKLIAGLYLNRLKKNWHLQADPTVIFALKQAYGDSLSVKRVLTRDLSTESAYNTYLCKGLPPGPISMPDISSIEAVLNPANHSYYYMCASTVEIGQHVFAKTNRQHQVNAQKYHRWINEQGLKR